MARKNRDIDVFRQIDMHHGDVSVCWEFIGQIKGVDGNERPYFSYGGKKYFAYRVVFDLFHPDNPLEKDEVVRHTCDNSICCNPTHLERGTHQENMDDMKKRERHGLPHHTVRAIRTLLATGDTHASIAEKFGVSRETVSAISQRRIYKEVEDNE